ncbi:transcriptional regulator [Salmonella enterica]|uniref:Transcriptional regulator n=3 Tax=Salmonella enterica TaxID=28901 RepID=A0A5U3D2T2_SALDZ|nr:transcriptional regulator [Salmonella enterica]EAA7933162.1 transcriptional regulator [Salmonella enterica subsp. enterica serovar Redlands]EBP3412455.1 transcriptional regulator [Salmonella enterica subsp. diarizonae]ECG1717899.1 transcriptional regulator [Salmonella enterica subsp. diarizonae serovar 17:z10:e,n,x,z15]EDW0434092.1 transcriptional regulator [Salmonella enterica subsp. enterica serovar Lexington]EAA7554581.1 transcriptional regulator [Salmonella enterica]
MSSTSYIYPSDFVFKHPFDNPLQRLIMIRILLAGSLDGEGERILDHETLVDFCCCSKQAMFKEIKNLERAGCLCVRQIGALTTGLNVRLEPARGYTILPPQEVL